MNRQIGSRPFYAHPVRFLDPFTNSTASFSCRYTFSIISSSYCPSNDGIAFIIAANIDFPSLSRGYMGLPGPVLNHEDSYFADPDVVFTNWGADPGGTEHISKKRLKLGDRFLSFSLDGGVEVGEDWVSLSHRNPNLRSPVKPTSSSSIPDLQ